MILAVKIIQSVPVKSEYTFSKGFPSKEALKVARNTLGSKSSKYKFAVETLIAFVARL